MHNYLDKLENIIGNTKRGKLLFNKHYNLKDLYWTLFYGISLSSLAGIGNSYSASGLNNFLLLFMQGFVNAMYLSIFVNIFYVKIIDKFSNLDHFRRNGNILWFTVLLLFIAWHYILGTENPLQANIMPGIASLVLTNYHISSISKQ
jgi:hypothetical protein